MIKSKEEIELLSNISTDIFKESKINMQMDRSTSVKFAWLKSIITFLQKRTVSDDDCQPSIVEEDVEKDNGCKAAFTLIYILLVYMLIYILIDTFNK